MENSKNKKKILIVDDDDNLRAVLMDKLSIFGFDTLGAENGEEGLEKSLALHPDVILLDIVMPKMNGWEMLEKLRQDEWGKNARVIMLTVLDNTDSIARAMEGGSYEYIVKTSHSLEEVVNKVAQTLGLPKKGHTI